mmetsp:Transcript_36515/g.36109  ORF Transcript_36515/g.36109 Transcript_36515/m.36109 type:complete len:217 (-) Transcript_36515:174-824(-)
MSRKSTSDENGDPLDSKKNLGGFFNLTTTAKNKVQKKRKKKGLGEKYPKHVSTTTQLFVGWTSAVVSKSLLTPLERAKVVLQVSHLANYTGFTKPKGALSVLGRIVKDQGLIALYRGNMAMVYLTTSKMIASIGFYDKFKRRLMPAGDNKYSGVNSAWRRVAAAMLSGSITIALSYPFELFFTRITADMNGKGAKRLYSNTFDCFNLTQLEGGFRN